MRVVDWLARMTMLVLAALATLALIGSLASVSSSSIGDAFPGRIAEQAAPASDAAPQPSPRPGESVAAETAEMAAAATIATAERVAASRERETARWLKALTYAVIALAAFAAAGVVALVRVGGHLARIAGR